MTAILKGDQTCGYCGNLHPGLVCHRVKAMEYHPNGNLKRVELHDAVGDGFVGRERFWESVTITPAALAVKPTDGAPADPPKVRTSQTPENQ